MFETWLQLGWVKELHKHMFGIQRSYRKVSEVIVYSQL